MKKELYYLKGYFVEILFTLGLMLIYALIVWVMTL